MRRIGRMKLFNNRDVQAERVEQGAKDVRVRWLITKDVGAENFAMRLFEVDSGGFTPLHNHPWEHEIFVLEGEGVVRGGEEEKGFKEGDVIFMPPDETHQLRNTGEGIVRFLCLIPH